MRPWRTTVMPEVHAWFNVRVSDLQILHAESID
jgi:hypothetical protein